MIKAWENGAPRWRVGRDGKRYDANPRNVGKPRAGVAKKAKPLLKKKPASKKPAAKRQSAALQEGGWEYYGVGGWKAFSGAAMAWLSNELDSSSAEVTREDRDSKKKASERRIRLVAPSPDRPPFDTDADTRAWRSSYYIIKAPLLKRLKEM